MAVDTSIYQMAGRGVKSVADYDAEYAQTRQSKLAELMGGMKMQGMQQELQDAQTARQDKLTLADLFRKNTGADGVVNQSGLYAGMAGAGQGAGIAGMRKTQGEADKLAAQTQGEQWKNTASIASARGSAAGAILQNPTYENAIAILTDLKSRMPADHAAQMDLSKVPRDPALIKQWADGTYRAGIDADKQLADATSRSNNKANNDTSIANNQANNATQMRGQNMTAGTAAAGRAQSDRHFGITSGLKERELSTKAAGGAAKPLPATALKMQQTSLDAINIASNTQADLGAIEKQIADGKLDFGPVSNLWNKGRNAAGFSSEESRNLSTFKSSLEKMRNDSLRLNAGVQTDGDAQRAWNELFENINDKGVVTQRLAEIKKLNSRAVVQHKLNVDGIRSNYGHDPMDTSGYENQGPAVGAGAFTDAAKEARFQAWKAKQ